MIDEAPSKSAVVPEQIEQLLVRQRRIQRERLPRWAPLAMRLLPYTLITMTIINLLIGGIAIITPYLNSWFGATVTDPIYTAYSFICPQRPSHTFHINGVPMAFEQRDVAMHIGFAVTGLMFIRVRWLRSPLPHLALVAGVLPMLVDVGLSTIGILPSTWHSRLWTGLLAAFVIVWWGYPRYDAYYQKARHHVKRIEAS